MGPRRVGIAVRNLAWVRAPADASLTMAGDRRPISTRDLAVSRRIAARLARWGWTPNGISIAGMVAGVAGGIALASTGAVESPGAWTARAGFVAGAAMAQVRLLANMFDGMVAVEHDQTSPVGDLYNELPDRVSDVAILVGMGYAAGGWPTAGWLAALGAVTTAYVRAQVVVSGAPQNYGGPMAKPQRMAVVTLAALYAGFAPVAWQPTLAATGWSPPLGLAGMALFVIAIGCGITCVRRIAAGGRALRSAP